MTTSTPNEQFESGRATAAALIADAYQRALATLHSQDVRERDWYEAQRRDARLVAGLAPDEAAASRRVIALTRAEARVIAGALDWTRGGYVMGLATERDATMSRELLAELIVRDGGGWWGNNDPATLDQDARWGRGECPESFPMSAAGLAVIVEVLPEMIASATKDLERDLADLERQGLTTEDLVDSDDAAVSIARKQALEGLAARLGVKTDRQVGDGMSAITLTRDEASAISMELVWTCADSSLFVTEDLDGIVDASSREGYERSVANLNDAIRRLRLEATIREGGGWWGEGSSPAWLDLCARCGKGECPESFAMSAEGAAALGEYCAEHLADFIAEADEDIARYVAMNWDEEEVEHERRRKAALISLASRFGVQIPQSVA